MNKIIKSTMLAAGAVLVTQGAHAQFANGDLLLGFTTSGSANEFVADLGNFSSVVGVGGTTPVNLSSDVNGGNGLTSFSSVFASGPNGLNVGVAGGNNSFGASSIYVTAARIGGAGNPAVAGSSTPTSLAHTPGKAGIAAVASMDSASGLSLSGGQSGVFARAGNAAGYSWFNGLENLTPPVGTSYLESTGYNPDSTASGSVVFLDLYGTPSTSSSGTYNFSYQGYFTFDDSGASPTLTFTPAATAVPEPSTYGIIAGAGLLLVCLRNRIGEKAA